MTIILLWCVIVFILAYFGSPNGGNINFYGHYNRLEYAFQVAFGSLYILGLIGFIINAIFGVNLLDY